MKLTCGNCGQAAVVRHDPESTGFLAMCDVCGWRATKVKAEFERAQKAEAEQRKRLGRGEERAEEKDHELAPASSRRG